MSIKEPMIMTVYPRLFREAVVLRDNHLVQNLLSNSIQILQQSLDNVMGINQVHFR